MLVGLAGLAALGLVPQLGVAALFAGIAAAVLARWRGHPARLVPGGLGGCRRRSWPGWWIAHRRTGTFDATVILLSYELVLLLVGGCFPLGAAAVLWSGRGWPIRSCRRDSWPGWTGWRWCSATSSATGISGLAVA